MNIFDNPREQIKHMAALAERQRAADRQVASMTPEQATQMAAFDKWFPWMPKGVMYSLARAGQTALGNPLIEQVAIRALVAKENTAIGLGQVGDPVTEKEPKKSWFGKVTHAAGTGVGWATGYTPVKKGLSAAVSRDNSVGTFARDNPVTDKVLEPGMRHVFTGENPLPRGLRALSRTAGAVGDFPRQVVQGGYRSAPTDQELFGQNPLKTATKWGAEIGTQTELGQTVEGAVRSEVSVDQGKGFFIGGQAKERQHIAEQQHGVIIYPDGSRHAITIGRKLAGLVSEPGSDAYAAISGGADLMVAVGADKVTFGNAAAARRADKAFKVEGIGPRAAQAASEGRRATARENLIDTIGGIAAPGKRLTVDPNGVRTFLASRGGTAFVDTLVETTSIKKLDRLTGGKWDPASLLAIADETDPDVAREMAYRLLTTGHVKNVPTTPLSRLGFSMREQAPEHLRRLNARMPKTGSEARHLRNPREAMTQFQREMDYLDIDQEVQDTFLRKFADAPDTGIVDPELANVAGGVHRRAIFEEFEDHMKGVLARSVGMDDKGVAKTRKLLQRENDRWKGETNYFLNNGVPESFFGLRTLDGDLPPSPAKFEKGPLSVPRRGPLWDQADEVLDDVTYEEGAFKRNIESPGVEPIYDPVKAGMSQRNMDDVVEVNEFANEIIDRMRAVIYTHADELPDEISEPLREYVEASYKHTSTSTLEDVGQVLETMGPGYHREVDDLLRDFGVPDMVTVYRGGVKRNEWAGLKGNAPRGDYVNASLLRSNAETFGLNVEEMQVPRSAILGIASPGEAEVIFRADAINQPYRRLGQITKQPNVPTPWDLNELQSNYMPSPDWRKVKHQMGVIGKMHANGIEVPLKAMRDVQTAWKGLVIARPALLLRVMGEIQFAMTLRGASTWLNHPLDMIAYVLGDSNAPKMLAKMKARGGSDIRGQVWSGHEDDAGEWVDAQMRWRKMEKTSTFYQPNKDKVLGNEFVIANKHQNPEGYYAGMADELHTISKSTFMFQRASDMLQGKSVEDSIGWAWNNMADERKVLANAFEDGDKILTIDGLDEYMRGIDERIMQATGDGNPELLQSLVSRKLRGETFDIKGVRNDKLNDVLRQFADNLPDDMRAPKTANRGAATQMKDVLKGVHGTALDIMFSNRERTLNRSPEFRQFYFKKAIERANVLDPAEADFFVANLEKAGMKPNDLRRAKYFAEKPVDTPMSLREVDDLAFAEAQDEMQFFLEDLVDKKRWVEALSIVSPFAHVISESMTRWGKILSDPNAVAKVQRPFKAARDPELGDIAHLNDDETDPERRGLLYKDAQGNERMAFPLSAKMTGILGDPIPLHGRTAGLNMIGDFSPGVGPMASLPLTALSEKLDNPRYDKIRDWIFPYGTPKGGIIERNVMQFLPTWARKAVTEETPQQVIDAMYYKANHGDYNVQGEGATVEEINRLINDSKQLAFVTKLSNAAATFFAPTAPSPEWFIEDEGGQRIPMLAVVKDLQAMRDADPRNATLNMLEKYGDNVFLMLVGKSVAVSPGVLPSTVEAEKWIRSDGKGLRGKYKNAYGFFAPQEGDFSFDAYRRLLDNGDRKLNDPDDVPFIANDMVAKARYYAVRAQLDNPSAPASAKLLRDFRAQLEKEYPGYDPDGPPGGTVNRASTASLIEELKASTEDKKLQDHEAMPVLKQYLDFRDQLNALAPKGRGTDWWHTAKDGRKARAMAAKFGDELAQENKAFAGMWEGALRREFETALANDDADNALGGG